MSDVWVVNASPVILLGRVGQLDLLTALANEVMIPDPVVEEILAGPESDPARMELESGWGKRVPVSSVPETLIEWGLGKGETSVLAMALGGTGFTAILDDGAARKCANALNIPVTGTLGVILRAKERGVISTARPILESLKDSGLYVDEQVIIEVLDRIGE